MTGSHSVAFLIHFHLYLNQNKQPQYGNTALLKPETHLCLISQEM